MKSILTIPLFLLGSFVAFASSCEKERPLKIPADAHTHLTAKDVATLRVVPGIGELRGLNDAAPAWYFCDDHGCAAGTSKKELILTTVSNRAEAEERWRSWTGATLSREHRGNAALTGHVDLARHLATSRTTTPRGGELLERATRQMGPIEMTVDELGAEALRGDFRLRTRAGEPQFVSDLGSPTAPLPDLRGLIDDETLGVARISVGPSELWALVRSTLTAEDRGRVDGLQEALRSELHLDAETAVLENLTGHFVVAVYSAEPGASIVDWLTGRATEEALVIGVSDTTKMRRFLAAMTQVSRGRLASQSKAAAPNQWAWLDEEGELVRTLVLGDDHLAVVDSLVAYERVQAMKADDADRVDHRGLGDLLGEGRKSGVHARVELLRAIGAPEFLLRWGWMTGIVEAADSEEVLRLRAGTD